jgi:hypothetical protein
MSRWERRCRESAEQVCQANSNNQTGSGTSCALREKTRVLRRKWGKRGWEFLRCEDFSLDPSANLLAVYLNLAWGVETQFHRVTTNFQHRDHDVGPDHDALSVFSAEYEHHTPSLLKLQGLV